MVWDIVNSSSLQAPYAQQAPKIIAVQVVSMLLSFVQYWLILNCLLPVNFWQTWIRMALTQFSNTIPITISGLGLREGFAIHLSGIGFSVKSCFSIAYFILHSGCSACPDRDLLSDYREKAVRGQEVEGSRGLGVERSRGLEGKRDRDE